MEVHYSISGHKLALEKANLSTFHKINDVQKINAEQIIGHYLLFT